MKNIFKFFSMIAVTMLLGFSMAACNSSSTSQSGANGGGGGNDGGSHDSAGGNSNASPGMPNGNSGIVGVWLSSYIIGTAGIEWRYFVFYDDGTFRFSLPQNGFVGFDKEQDKIARQEDNIWGTYTMNGSTGTWSYDASPNAVSQMNLAENGGLDLGTSYNVFYRCSSVDDVRFDGSYTSYANPSDPALSNPGQRPVIHFKSDGTFVDDGLYATVYVLCPNHDTTQCAPGSGTYQLKDYTLILSYSDGRTNQTAFTFSYGPNSTALSGIVIVDDGLQLNQMP
ncbi:MAG: hypothetical protein FWD73_00865 [Polyangiaceae bacterium]|nr:hypothetical protein [Polyangiaceae bacterium]